MHQAMEGRQSQSKGTLRRDERTANPGTADPARGGAHKKLKFIPNGFKIQVVENALNKRVSKTACIFFVSLIPFVFASCIYKPEKKRIVVSYCYSGNQAEPHLSCMKSVVDTFTADKGYELRLTNAHLSVESQLQDVQLQIWQGTQYLILDPVSEHGYSVIADYVKYNKVPLFLACGTLDIGFEDDSRIPYEVRPDYAMEGDEAAKWLESHDEEQTEHNICMITGYSDLTSDIERFRAVERGIERNPKWNLVLKREARNDNEYAKYVMDDMFQVNSDIDVVFVTSQESALGVIDSVYRHGKMPGRDVLILVFCADESIEDFVEAGIVSFATIVNGAFGPDLEKVVAASEKLSSFYRSGSSQPRIVVAKDKERNLGTEEKKKELQGLRFQIRDALR